MEIRNKNIDEGRAFDWGKTSEEYAIFRDIYPQTFYEKIVDRGLCVNGQNVLDIGTGTGVLPRNMYRYGAKWIGVDISENQVKQEIKLSQKNGMNIDYIVSPAEDIDFQEKSFDVITACQCFWYFNHKVLAPKLAKLLKKDGRLLVLSMVWLPFEDEIARKSEELVLKYNPKWSGAGFTRHPIKIPNLVLNYFDIVYHEEYDVKITFTKKSWNGRMKACRGIGASLSPTEITFWEKEHLLLLDEIIPKKFDILHYVAFAELRAKQ